MRCAHVHSFWCHSLSTWRLKNLASGQERPRGQPGALVLPAGSGGLAWVRGPERRLPCYASYFTSHR